MIPRTPGPFAYYGGTYAGATGESIRTAVDAVDIHAKDLGALADELKGDQRRILETTEGDIRSWLAGYTHVPELAARGLAGKAQYAAGCTREFALGVDTFDTTVNGINEDYRTRVVGAQHDPDVRSGDLNLSKLKKEFEKQLYPRYRTAEDILESAAQDIGAKLNRGPTDEAVRELIRQGLIPLASASYFPTLVLSDDDQKAAYAALVRETMAELREVGLLTGADPDGYYLEWLQNATERGVPIEEIIDIARDHGITPEDFEVLDGLEEVNDPAGKSFFILPSDISGGDARNAVLMTYILNAGTDYGTANGGDTNFTETPYSSDEIQRIKDRQEANNWFSYDQDVGFVHGNGGTLATTPNGMLMGVGGNWLQDLYSAQGGSTWGEIFMTSIDDPEDADAAMRDIITSGEGATTDDDGEPVPRGDHLDLDRLLHHEERHSQQWAEEGHGAFIRGYASEMVDWHIETKGPFGWPAPYFTEGRDNSYEVDAGLTDGGYEE